MKNRIKATVAALATMGLLAAIFALPALAQSGVDEAWTNDMNQTSYWEARFGAECDKFHNHSGFIPAGYDFAVVKDGTQVRVYDQPGPFTALGPVNPANGKHHEAPHSWVIKCTKSSTSSTTTSSTSSTTSTTSTSLVTTTTVPETTTTEQTTTTTVPDSTTTTVASSSTTSTVGSTTPTELPFTGAWTSLMYLLAAGLGLVGGLILYLTKTQP